MPKPLTKHSRMELTDLCDEIANTRPSSDFNYDFSYIDVDGYEIGVGLGHGIIPLCWAASPRVG